MRVRERIFENLYAFPTVLDRFGGFMESSKEFENVAGHFEAF